jgi:arylsulfatase
MYYTMSQPGPTGWILPLTSFHFTLVQNIKRDPFEQAVGVEQKTAMSIGGALAGPVTAFQYDWNMLPIGQQLWLKELESYVKYPPLQEAASYNLTQVMEQVKKAQSTPSE